MELQVQKLHPDAKVPSFAHDTDAGMDVYCVEEMTVAPSQRVQIRTGIALGIPKGYVGLIWDKSGIAHKAGLKTLGGVVDSGYTGEVFVGIFNTSTETHTFLAGDKVAQILIQKIEQPAVVEVASLAASERGTGAFGSTGK